MCINEERQLKVDLVKRLQKNEPDMYVLHNAIIIIPSVRNMKGKLLTSFQLFGRIELVSNICVLKKSKPSRFPNSSQLSPLKAWSHPSAQ